MSSESCEQPQICGKCQTGFVSPVGAGKNLQCLEPSSLLLKYFNLASLALAGVVVPVCVFLRYKKQATNPFLLFKTTTCITDVAGHIIYALVLLETGVFQISFTILLLVGKQKHTYPAHTHHLQYRFAVCGEFRSRNLGVDSLHCTPKIS